MFILGMIVLGREWINSQRVQLKFLGLLRNLRGHGRRRCRCRCRGRGRGRRRASSGCGTPGSLLPEHLDVKQQVGLCRNVPSASLCPLLLLVVSEPGWDVQLCSLPLAHPKHPLSESCDQGCGGRRLGRGVSDRDGALRQTRQTRRVRARVRRRCGRSDGRKSRRTREKLCFHSPALFLLLCSALLYRSSPLAL